MTLTNLKNQILVNRNILAGLYENKKFFKDAKRYCDDNGNTAMEYSAHNNLKRVSKDIARMVVLQQALKFEVQCKLQRARESKLVMGWMKGWMKKGITFVNVNHARKNGGGAKANSKGAELSEEDMMGSSTIFKSGGVNLILMRNKDAESDEEKNTTIMKLSKARGVGDTGMVGKYFYEMEKHKLWDLDDWQAQHQHQF